MTKNTLRGYALVIVLLAIFCAVSFLIPFSRTTVFWIGFGFGAFAILFQLHILKSSFGRDESVKSRFYGFPIARIGLCYLCTQLILSLAEMALTKVIPIWLALVINILVMGIVLIGCLFVSTMREEISRQDSQLKQNVKGMRGLQSLARTIAVQCDDKQLKPLLEKLADDFRYSDPVTSSSTEALENDLFVQLNEIQQAVVDSDKANTEALCKKISGCLTERNRMASLSK